MTTRFPEDLLRCIDDADSKGNPIQTNLMFRRDVPLFRTDFFFRSMRLFNQWLLFKRSPPQGIGFANERSTTCRILSILYEEQNLYDAWERERQSQSRRK